MMLLWVLEDNQSECQFYESMGDERVGRKTITIGGGELDEVSYGWRNVSDLIVGD